MTIPQLIRGKSQSHRSPVLPMQCGDYNNSEESNVIAQMSEQAQYRHTKDIHCSYDSFLLSIIRTQE
jgi:hypothetical protein